MSRSASQVRSEFLSFFEERGHRVVASGPVFPSDDPTLLFTNAGMNQFKDVFLGTGSREYTRAVDTQKCIRVSGKHNDLEEVGVDTYHHTFFEMVGNWSFGDYFKKDAICWAWELLTEVWGLPKDRLWVTVFSGDEKDGLGPDEEAERLWIEEAGISADRVLRFDRRDNFWEMGETGPCGPCSEIHIDRGGPDTNPEDGADPEEGVNAGNERFIELWNLVFMEFNRIDGGELQPLPSQHVDTGMGLERVVSVLQGRASNYDTDLFTPIFERLTKVTGVQYSGGDEPSAVAFRVIADHLRAVSVSMADGALPSNTGRGYVLRRLLRRAARFGKQALQQEEPFLHLVVPSVCDVLEGPFPEVREREGHISNLVREEEIAFGRTLGRGIAKFEELAEKTSPGASIEGAVAYELYSTYGFPRDLVEQMARERGLDLEAPGWEKAQKDHQEASKSEGRFTQLLTAEQIAKVEAGGAETSRSCHEIGDRGVQGDALVTLCEPQVGGDDGAYVIVLDQTPFYPEGGGQVGDQGLIQSGDISAEVVDTKALGGIVVHVARFSDDKSFLAGDQVETFVDRELRSATKKHHTATHLLHAALREVVGDHVVQQGSYVGPDRLRFDFANPGSVSAEQLDKVERAVNSAICANSEVLIREEDLELAKSRGATALFGEKYDDVVRVVGVGECSVELCGGTHVEASGEIGPFLITSERAIQAGVRRIEAVCGLAAIEEIQAQRGILRGAAGMLKVTPAEMPDRILHLQGQVKKAKGDKKAADTGDVEGALQAVKDAMSEINGVQWAAVKVDGLDMDGIRDLSARIKGLDDHLVVAIMAASGSGVPFMVLSQGAALEKGIMAGELAKGLGALVGGGGGGRPDAGQGQGSKPEALGEALEWVSGKISETLKA